MVTGAVVSVSSWPMIEAKRPSVVVRTGDRDDVDVVFAGSWLRIEAKGPNVLVVPGESESAEAGAFDLYSGEPVVLEEKEVAGVDSRDVGSELSGVAGSGELSGDEGHLGLKEEVSGVVGSTSAATALKVGCFGVVGEPSTTSIPPM